MANSGSGSGSSSSRPIIVDAHDMPLANSQVLTRKEVIQRRLRRMRKLGRCYRVHYWALMEKLRSKYREYRQTFGKSPFKEDQPEDDNDDKSNDETGNEGDDIVKCHFTGCMSNAMALTKYCHAHILSDPKQKLYQRCSVIVKSLPTGPAFCKKPALRSMTRPVCPMHQQFSQRCLARALKKAGAPPKREPAPKFHVLVSEFVHQIQNKRKQALKDETDQQN